jgi:hypothetical protein
MALARSFIKPERQLHCAKSLNISIIILFFAIFAMGAINTCHGHMMGSGPGSLKNVQGFLRLHTRSGWNCSSGYGLELGTCTAQATHLATNKQPSVPKAMQLFPSSSNTSYNFPVSEMLTTWTFPKSTNGN